MTGSAGHEKCDWQARGIFPCLPRGWGVRRVLHRPAWPTRVPESATAMALTRGTDAAAQRLPAARGGRVHRWRPKLCRAGPVLRYLRGDVGSTGGWNFPS